MQVISKLATTSGAHLWVVGCTVAVAAATVALNSSRKRRREGRTDSAPARRLPGGRGGTRQRSTGVVGRYVGAGGKKEWMLRPQSTQWYLDYVEHAHLAADPSTVLGRAFRHKFRLPYDMYSEILQDMRASRRFPDDQARLRKRGQRPHPLSMKLMAALRRLALGVSVDGLECMAGISATRLNEFIPDWEAWFVEQYYDKWVKMPTGPKVQESVELFRRCGMPGCISSMDVCHVRYDRCPYAARYPHTGKEGYPTLGYQFHVGHNREIYWVSHGFPGARNDKTVVRYDKFQQAMQSEQEYTDFRYKIYTAIGQEEEMKGVYTLCDGGYHKWLTSICGSKHADAADLKGWSGLCESVRKDVECVFGILKKRFAILAGRFLNYESADIDRTVKVCCILHNMVLHASGLADVGSDELHWKTVDAAEAKRYGLRLDDMSGFIVGSQAKTDQVAEVHAGWFDMRNKLVMHYNIALAVGEVQALRTRDERIKAAAQA